MPIEMHPVAARRIFRLVLVTTFSLWVSQAMNWGASFIVPVLLSMLLAIPLPGLKLKQGLIFILALVIPIWFSTWFLLPVLTYQPMVGMLLLIAACFWAFYYSASGGSPILGAFLTMGLAIVAAVGSDSIDSVIAIDKALTFNRHRAPDYRVFSILRRQFILPGRYDQGCEHGSTGGERRHQTGW